MKKWKEGKTKPTATTIIKNNNNKSKFSEKLLDTIYPPVCGICGKLNENSLCKKCEKILNKQAKFIIEKNVDINKNFAEHLYIFIYQGIIRELIIDYKFNEKTYLYRTFVNFLLKNKKLFKNLKSYDTIIPVPISQKRNKERGYNQSYLIAKEITNYVDLKLENNSLIKTKNIVEQSKLNKEERIRNIQGVYELKNKEKLFNKKILLIDDIYTTGSTVSECCKVLKEAEPKRIGVLTLAKD